METKRVFFWRPQSEPLTHKEYIYLAHYKYNHPEEEVNLCLAHPYKENEYTLLTTQMSVAILPLDTEEFHDTVLPIRTHVIKNYNILRFPFFDMSEFISRCVDNDTSVLDLGCGNKTFTNKIHRGRITTVDGFAKFAPDVIWDLNTFPLPFSNNHYDIVLLIDVIEHLDKELGVKLLEEAKRICKKKVFVFTPLWWMDNSEETNNPESDYYQNHYNLHRSLWTIEEFREFKRVESRLVDNYFFGYWEKE